MGIMRHLFTDEASTDYLVDNYRYQLSWQSEKNAFIENPDLPMMSAQGWSESLRELEKMETIIRRRRKEKDQTTILFLILELKEEKMKVKKNIYRLDNMNDENPRQKCVNDENLAESPKKWR